jgi:hypothetical protein
MILRWEQGPAISALKGAFLKRSAAGRCTPRSKILELRKISFQLVQMATGSAARTWKVILPGLHSYQQFPPKDRGKWG